MELLSYIMGYNKALEDGVGTSVGGGYTMLTKQIDPEEVESLPCCGDGYRRVWEETPSFNQLNGGILLSGDGFSGFALLINDKNGLLEVEEEGTHMTVLPDFNGSVAFAVFYSAEQDGVTVPPGIYLEEKSLTYTEEGVVYGNTFRIVYKS